MMIEAFTARKRIAYFTMEVALRPDIPTYAGGLGVLAGDLIRSAADCELPLVCVSLASREGYFHQEIDATGRQAEHPAAWVPAEHARRLGVHVAVPIEGRDVWVGSWLYVLRGATNGEVPVILLDTDLDQNDPLDRAITRHLYGGDARYRLNQEIVLGIGGVRILEALGLRIWQFHLNEGHSALLTLELLRESAYAPGSVRPGEARYNLQQVRGRCNFTTHTPVEAGHDRFGYDLSQRVLGDLIEISVLKALAGEDALDMTRLALNLSEYVNGVAKRHADTSRRMFPGYRVRAVTNGIHAATWASPPLQRLFDEHLPGWQHEPEILVRAECCIADEDLWRAHQQSKEALIAHVHQTVGVGLDPHRPIIGFARRMTSYKRPQLVFSDPQRLRALARTRPFQLVFAGKAHPDDEGGKQAIQTIYANARELSDCLPIVFLPNYDMSTAAYLVAGCDLWLNTPLPPLEASGTSGMKAALNGVPNLSILDGWWVEGCIEGITGWAIGDGRPQSLERDAAALYEKLERVVLPLYWNDRPGWIAVMKGAISKNGSIFTSHRMIRRYATDAYLR
jgi:glycogen phosphorylase